MSMTQRKRLHNDARTRKVYAHSGNASQTRLASLLMAHGEQSWTHARIVRTSARASKSTKYCSSRVSNKRFAYAASHAWVARSRLHVVGLCGCLLTDREAGYGLSIILANSEDNWAAMLGFRNGLRVPGTWAGNPSVLRGEHVLHGV